MLQTRYVFLYLITLSGNTYEIIHFLKEKGNQKMSYNHYCIQKGVNYLNGLRDNKKKF